MTACIGLCCTTMNAIPSDLLLNVDDAQFLMQDINNNKGVYQFATMYTVKLVHKIMRVFYSHCFAFRYACYTQCVTSGGMFCLHVKCVPEKAWYNE